MADPIPGLFVMSIMIGPDDGLNVLRDFTHLAFIAINLVNAQREPVSFVHQVLQPNTEYDIITPAFDSLPFTSIDLRQTPCSSMDFEDILQSTEPLIEDLYASVHVIKTQFQLDVFSASTTYQACFDSTKSLLGLVPSLIVQMVKSCTQPETSPDFNTDPCCVRNDPQRDLTPVACCAARPIPVEASSFYDNVSNPTVNQSCSSEACAHSFLETFAQVLNDQQQDLTSCTSPISTEALQSQIILAYRGLQECHQASGMGPDFTGIPCRTDADCSLLPEAVCNLQSKRCDGMSLDAIEDLYLRCFIDHLSGFSLTWVKKNVLPAYASTLDKDSPEFFTLLREASLASDCISNQSVFDISHRSRVVSEIESDGSGLSFLVSLFHNLRQATMQDLERECAPQDCLGLSCPYQPNNCWEYCHLRVVPIESTFSDCLANNASICNFDTCDGAFTCAYCIPSGACISDPLIDTEAECLSSTACELRDGTIRFDLSIDECLAQSYCTVDCPGQACRSLYGFYGVCEAMAISSVDACVLLDEGDPQWYEGVCLLTSLTEYHCITHINTRWWTCEEQTMCDMDAPIRHYLGCFSDIYQACSSQAECEGSGRCSDIEATRVVDWSNLSFPKVYYGACFTPGTWSQSILTIGGGDTSFCVQDQTRTRNGCQANILSISSPAQCYKENPSLGGNIPAAVKWLTPSTSKLDCLSQTGCNLLIDTESRLDWRDAEDCLACGGQREPFWDWEPGRWVSAQPRPLLWLQKLSMPKYTWKPAVSFQTTEGWVTAAVQESFSISLRSQALCNFELISSPLSALVCDCFSSDQTNGGCYAQVPVDVPLALGVACEETASHIRFGSSFLEFFKNSVQSGCVNIRVARIDQSVFEYVAPPPQVSFRLAASHLSRTSPVVNQRGGVVGSLIGNGIKIDADNPAVIGDSYLCLQLEQDYSQMTGAGHSFDFGKSDSQLKSIFPRHISPIFLQTLANITLICGNITQIEPKNAYFFPIIRLIDDEAVSSSEYSQSDTALIYTLGALYSVCLVFMGMFCVAALWWFHSSKSGDPSMLIAGLFFVLLCIFRIVYCFMFPSDVITDRVADYAVFELPTFFYFTSFSIILGIWFQAAVPPRYRSRSRKIVVVVVNVVGYSLFVAVMIAIAIIDGQSAEDPSECPGRVPGVPSSQADHIRTLSLVYQSIVIAITFILAVAFILSIYYMLKNGRRLRQSWFEVYRSSHRVFQVAMIVVVGFLTRCILFIIILAADFTSTIYMFITLSITEILVIILVCTRFALLKQAGKAVSRRTASSSSRSQNVASVKSISNSRHESQKSSEMQSSIQH